MFQFNNNFKLFTDYARVTILGYHAVARHRIVGARWDGCRRCNSTQTDGFASSLFPGDGVGWIAKQEQQE